MTVTLTNSTTEQYQQLLNGFLAQFDDFIQQAEDNGKDADYYQDSFNKVEQELFNIKNSTDKSRNLTRMLIKETMKMAVVDFHQEEIA